MREFPILARGLLRALEESVSPLHLRRGPRVPPTLCRGGLRFGEAPQGTLRNLASGLGELLRAGPEPRP